MILGCLSEKCRRDYYATTIPLLVTIHFTSSTPIRRLIDDLLIIFHKASDILAVRIKKETSEIVLEIYKVRLFRGTFRKKNNITSLKKN